MRMKAASPETAPGPLILLGGMGLQPGFVPAWREILAPLSGPMPRLIILPVAQSERKPAFEQRVRWAEELFSSMGVTTQAIEMSAHHPPTFTLSGKTDCVLAMADESLISSLSSRETQPHQHAGLQLWDALWEQHRTGTAVIAVANVTAVLGEHTFAPIKPFPPMLDMLEFVLQPGARRLPGTAILPYFDRLPHGLLDKLKQLLPSEITLIGIDEQAALISGIDGWHVAGVGSVTILIHNQVAHVARAGTHIPDQLLSPPRR